MAHTTVKMVASERVSSRFIFDRRVARIVYTRPVVEQIDRKFGRGCVLILSPV